MEQPPDSRALTNTKKNNTVKDCMIFISNLLKNYLHSGAGLQLLHYLTKRKRFVFNNQLLSAISLILRAAILQMRRYGAANHGTSKINRHCLIARYSTQWPVARIFITRQDHLFPGTKSVISNGIHIPTVVRTYPFEPDCIKRSRQRTALTDGPQRDQQCVSIRTSQTRFEDASIIVEVSIA